MPRVQGKSLSARQPLGAHDVRGMREGDEVMTLHERTEYCLKLAQAADDVEVCDAYIAEATGLMGKPLAASLRKHLIRYELGVRDRETMRKLEDVSRA